MRNNDDAKELLLGLLLEMEIVVSNKSETRSDNFMKKDHNFKIYFLNVRKNT